MRGPSTCSALLLSSLIPSSLAAETILGVYMFHRHGDRTPKSTPPANLTDLGYREVYQSGAYFNSRYVAANASFPIAGISNEHVLLSQIQITAPVDNVLQSSAMGFTQSLYPALGEGTGNNGGAQILADGSTAQSPLNGYQLIPVNTISSGSGSEDSSWLQSTSNCANAAISSNDYYFSPEYMTPEKSTADFYQSLLPVINGTFNSSTATFKNAYTIFDLINVAEIHNATINGSSLLTNETLLQIRGRANTHELNLAYNASSTIRAVSGMTLAGQAVQYLNSTIESLYAGKSSDKLAVQFGAYGTFTSLFGLMDVLQLDVALTGVCDYASAMAFELFTNTAYSGHGKLPADADLNIRFRFHNGTTTTDADFPSYALFNSSASSMPWADFVRNMNSVAIYTNAQWCSACGNSTGTCAPDALSSEPGSGATGSSPTTSSSGGGGMSLGVAGVIGAMVTLAVIFLAEAAVLLLGGFRLVSKKRLAGRANGVKA